MKKSPPGLFLLPTNTTQIVSMVGLLYERPGLVTALVVHTFRSEEEGAQCEHSDDEQANTGKHHLDSFGVVCAYYTLNSC